MQNHNFKIWGLIAFLALAGCQKSTVSELQQAQTCLNTAPAADALACVSNLASDYSAAASSLKCSAIFISEGFGTAVSFVNALDKINSGGTCTGGCSSTINALNALNFKSAGTGTAAARAKNNSTATEAFNVCSLAKVKFYTQISSLFKIGTDLSMLAFSAGIVGTTPTEDELKAQINNMNSADLGTLVTSTFSAACTDTTGASDATKKYCTELQSAMTGLSTPEAIGACMKKKLINPSDTCP